MDLNLIITTVQSNLDSFYPNRSLPSYNPHYVPKQSNSFGSNAVLSGLNLVTSVAPSPVTYVDNSVNIGSTKVTNNVQNISTKEKSKEEEKPKEEKEDNTLRTAMAVGGIVVTAVASTYYAAKDEYIKFNISGIDNLIKDIYGYLNTAEKDELETNYRTWFEAFSERTKPVTYSKGGIVGFTTIGLTGLWASSSAGLIGGIFGVTASSCYWLWKKMTHRPDNERIRYERLMSNLLKIKNTYANIENESYLNLNKPNTSTEPEKNKESILDKSDYVGYISTINENNNASIFGYISTINENNNAATVGYISTINEDNKNYI